MGVLSPCAPPRADPGLGQGSSLGEGRGWRGRCRGRGRLEKWVWEGMEVDRGEPAVATGAGGDGKEGGGARAGWAWPEGWAGGGGAGAEMEGWTPGGGEGGRGGQRRDVGVPPETCWEPVERWARGRHGSGHRVEGRWRGGFGHGKEGSSGRGGPGGCSYLSRLSSCRRLQGDHAGPPRAGAAPSEAITCPLGPQPLPGAPSCSRPKLRRRRR